MYYAKMAGTIICTLFMYLYVNRLSLALINRTLVRSQYKGRQIAIPKVLSFLFPRWYVYPQEMIRGKENLLPPEQLPLYVIAFILGIISYVLTAIGLAVIIILSVKGIDYFGYYILISYIYPFMLIIFFCVLNSVCKKR